MKKINLFLLLFFIVNFSIAQSYQKDSIVYKNMTSCLVLYNDSTFIYKRLGIDIARNIGIGDDTITYGKYVSYKNKSLYLFSNPDIMSSQMNCIGKETLLPNDNSIHIIINSHFHRQKQVYTKQLNNAYFYMVEVIFAENKKKQDLSSTQVFFSDTILFYNIYQNPVKEINIRIYPYKPIGSFVQYYPYLFFTYRLKNSFSNYLNFEIPQFSAYYIYYERFNAKEVEIIDSCTIAIDKKYLLWRCDANSFDEDWNFIFYQLENPYNLK